METTQDRVTGADVESDVDLPQVPEVIAAAQEIRR